MLTLQRVSAVNCQYGVRPQDKKCILAGTCLRSYGQRRGSTRGLTVQTAEKGGSFAERGEKRVPGAKARIDFAPVMPGRPEAEALGYQSRPISETGLLSGDTIPQEEEVAGE